MNSKYVLSITFGDYKSTNGGVAKVVSTHQRMFNEKGISYICIYPFNLSNSVHKTHNTYWGVIIDGVYDSVCSTNMLLNRLAKLSTMDKLCECVHIHHLLYIDVSELSKVLECVNSKIYFYLHDYYTICTSTKLIGEDGQLCDGNFLSGPRCKECKYYTDSVTFKEVFEHFVSTVDSRMTFIAPSDACKKWFLRQYRDYSENVVVVYHQTLEGDYMIPSKSDSVIRIGYVGVPIAAKGWNQFKRLNEIYKDNKNYEFVYFSSVIDNSVNIKHITVDFQQSLTAMQDALRNEKIDYVILWSVWPETYSYTYYESYSAGCSIITNKDSGNMSDQVERMDSGLVLSEEQLIHYFSCYENAYNYRCKYIKEKKIVSAVLKENDKIIEMSNCVPTRVKFEQHMSCTEMIKSMALKELYSFKLKLKKRR